MSIQLEIAIGTEKRTETFETVPRIGEKIAVKRDGKFERLRVTDVIHYQSGGEFQVGVKASRN